MSKQRVIWIDIVKYICISFVMISHMEHNSATDILGAFYEPFFLSGFLFASGYTFSFKRGFFDHLIKKLSNF